MFKRCTPGKMYVSGRFPITHYSYTTPSFVKMLGFSTARLLAVPVVGISTSFSFN